VELPAGARSISVPEAQNVDSPFGWYSLVVESKPDRVTVKGRLGLRVTRVTPAQYPAFKRFCEDVDRAMSQRLVIEP
jgi:hypothetical protein